MKYTIRCAIVSLAFISSLPVYSQLTQGLVLSTDTAYIGCDYSPVQLNPYILDLSKAGLTYKYYHGSWNQLPDFSSLSPVDSGFVSNLSISNRTVQNYYGFVFEGFIYLETAGVYTFYTSSDDGSKLYLNGIEVVDNDGLHGSRERSGTINLSKGMHAVRVTFFEKSGGEVLSWKYEGPGISKQSVPDNVLFNSDLSNVSYSWTGPGGFGSNLKEPLVSTLGTYHLSVTNGDTTVSDSLPLLLHQTPQFDVQGAWLACGQDSVAIGSNLNSQRYVQGLRYDYYLGNWNSLPDFASLSPASSGTLSNFSLDDRTVEDYYGFVFEGLIYLDTAGFYTFYVASDDGSRIILDDSLLVNNDGTHSTLEKNNTINLAKGYHEIEVQFFERNGYANLSVSYAGPGISKTLIPNEVLFYLNENSYSYNWTGPNGFSDSLAEVYVQEAGTYSLTITNDETQCSATDTAWVEYYCGDFSGRIFEDENENGDFDEGEFQFDSVKIVLFDDQQNLIDSTISDSSGSFWFADIEPRSYQFQLSNLPEQMELLSGLTGYTDEQQGGIRYITTPMQAINSGSSASIVVPMRRAAVLPVEYLDLQLSVENEFMTLKWSTAWEQNNEKFVIERSLDGKLFGVIGEVPSQGDSKSPVSYQFVDEDRAIAHRVDQWYYRIRQVDIDGQFHLSQILLGRMETAEIPLEVVGYPNPITGAEFKVRYSAASQNEAIQFKVINALGKEVLYRELPMGQSQEFAVDVANWPNGYYYLQIQSGEKQSVFKLQKL